jgi:hypothetical protein
MTVDVDTICSNPSIPVLISRAMEEERQESGAPSVPSVDPARLRQVWDFMRDWEARHPGVGIGRSAAKREVGSMTDLDHWVSYRAGMLWILSLYYPDDPLAPWRRGLGLDDVVFRVAAVFPIEWVGEGIREGLPFDVGAFLRQLRDNRGGLVQ